MGLAIYFYQLSWSCSNGGKSILVNASLTSIPMNGGDFFLQEVGNNKKYHELKWKVLA
jgi:hypothetical protein